jgi:hypothetical protein
MTDRRPSEWDKFKSILDSVDVARELYPRLAKLFARPDPFTDHSTEPEAERPADSTADLTAKVERLELKLKQTELAVLDQRAQLVKERERVGQLKATGRELSEQVHWYRSRFGREETILNQDSHDDPYPHFWRWPGGNTHFYRADSPDVMYFKFRASDNWTPATVLRESDMGMDRTTPTVRDYDNPDDPRNQFGGPTARAIGRPRRFARAEPVGHGTDDRSHQPDVVIDDVMETINVDVVAVLPANWPETIGALLREVDLNASDWRDLLEDALLTTIDDWVDFGQRYLLPYIQRRAGESPDAVKDIHETLLRGTGAAEERR